MASVNNNGSESLNSISDSVRKLRQDLKDEIKRRDEEAEALKSSLNFAHHKIEELLVSLNNEKVRTNSLTQDVQNLTKNITDLNNGCTTIIGRVDYQEDQSRRSNLRFQGIPDPKANETWEHSQTLIENIIKIKLGITNKIEFERVHRTGKWVANRKKPRDIVVKFHKYQDREAVFKKRFLLKDSNIFINEDFC